ncbi:hypothetical protein T492DRAFT_1028933 [Pavlovales sp. CCMP2436]|nr:hypothetical protein T492DRAFT_1028933 [Pavlovales sp. CCMP2436]
MADTLPELDDDALAQVLGLLGAADLDSCRGTCRAWRATGSEPKLWRRLLQVTYFAGSPEALPEQPLAPLGDEDEGVCVMPSSELGPAPSWRVAFLRWHALSRRVDGPRPMDAALWMQIAGAWARLERALRGRMPAIKETLCSPASAEQLAVLHSRGLRYIHAIHDGQELALDRFMLAQDNDGVRANRDSVCLGLFGGYSVYNHRVHMRMHPLQISVGIATSWESKFKLGEAHADAIALAGSDRLEIVSVSHSLSRFFAVDCADVLYIHADLGGWEVAAPSLGAWFCEHARRVEDGTHRIGHVLGPESPAEGIMLFPCRVDGEFCSREVTQGIEVVASAVYCPEHPQTFCYSLRFLMHPDAPHASAQLVRRRWLISDGSEEPRHVVGDGVVGMFPVLRRGGGYRDDRQAKQTFSGAASLAKGKEREGWFEYQSFSGPMGSAEGGKFAGDIMFVPGSLAAPTGEPFAVSVAPFRLARAPLLF